MINRKMQDLARSIERARWQSDDSAYQKGIARVAHAIADDLCTGVERHHFLLACGVPFNRE